MIEPGKLPVCTDTSAWKTEGDVIFFSPPSGEDWLKEEMLEVIAIFALANMYKYCDSFEIDYLTTINTNLFSCMQQTKYACSRAAYLNVAVRMEEGWSHSLAQAWVPADLGSTPSFIAD